VAQNGPDGGDLLHDLLLWAPDVAFFVLIIVHFGVTLFWLTGTL